MNCFAFKADRAARWRILQIICQESEGQLTFKSKSVKRGPGLLLLHLPSWAKRSILFSICTKVDGAGAYIRYDPKKLRRTVQRIDSGKCKLWHKLAKNASILEKDNMTDVMCSGCKCLINELNQRLKKVQNTTSEQKQHHVNASSRFPEKYLSPKSLKKKRQNMQQE